MIKRFISWLGSLTVAPFEDLEHEARMLILISLANAQKGQWERGVDICIRELSKDPRFKSVDWGQVKKDLVSSSLRIRE